MLLALDTSTTQIGVALYDGARVLAEAYWQSGRRHTQELAPLVAQVLQQTGFAIEDVQAVGVALGPGSFTGLRIGLAFAKGLAVARGLALVGVPTLEAVAAAVPLDVAFPSLAAVLPAGRGRLAVGWYTQTEGRWQAAGGPEIFTAETLAQRIRKPTVVCGELTADERSRLARKYRTVRLPSPAACARRPAFLAELAWQRWQQGQTHPVASLAPIYLHTGTPIPA
ncbi:MAG TPA: tRNA (adenosine(37)-N6)-threonylcarbamoyltransferase complex dimerization subunit type 1 TsaB [Chloroflexi bacterium]|nr:tRNA (adenosine(37)-N6)-threonylcarbamoyltransferase complex dimerization subunit type 1 TsaB [Chloroflexota bacterium]